MDILGRHFLAVEGEVMLTGRTRYRIGFRKKLVMQVEEWVYPIARYALTLVNPYIRWRDATIEDLQAIERGEVQAENPGPKRRRPMRPKPEIGTQGGYQPVSNGKPMPPPPAPPEEGKPRPRFVKDHKESERDG